MDKIVSKSGITIRKAPYSFYVVEPPAGYVWRDDKEFGDLTTNYYECLGLGVVFEDYIQIDRYSKVNMAAVEEFIEQLAALLVRKEEEK